MELVEIELHVAAVGDCYGIADCFGRIDKERFHLLGAAQIELAFGVDHPVGVVNRPVGADADQYIVGVGILFANVVDIGRGNQPDIHLL